MNSFIPISNEIMLILGLIAHYVQILYKVSEKRNCVVWPHQLLVQRPYKAIIALIGAILGYATLRELEVTQFWIYFGAGYAGNLIVDEVGRLAVKRIKG